MRLLAVLFGATLICFSSGLAWSQQGSRSGAGAQDLHQEAAQLQELRGRLNNPDPTVRMLALRSVARSNNPLHKRLAISLGISSADAEVHEMAVRVLLSSVRQIRIDFLDTDGQPISSDETSGRPELPRQARRHGRQALDHLLLTITTFDVETGFIDGVVEGASCGKFTGSVPGARISWATRGNRCSGTLQYNQEIGEFRGTLNLGRQPTELVRWRHN